MRGEDHGGRPAVGACCDGRDIGGVGVRGMRPDELGGLLGSQPKVIAAQDGELVGEIERDDGDRQVAPGGQHDAQVAAVTAPTTASSSAVVSSCASSTTSDPVLPTPGADVGQCRPVVGAPAVEPDRGGVARGRPDREGGRLSRSRRRDQDGQWPSGPIQHVHPAGAAHEGRRRPRSGAGAPRSSFGLLRLTCPPGSGEPGRAGARTPRLPRWFHGPRGRVCHSESIVASLGRAVVRSDAAGVLVIRQADHLDDLHAELVQVVEGSGEGALVRQPAHERGVHRLDLGVQGREGAEQPGRETAADADEIRRHRHLLLAGPFRAMPAAPRGRIR